MWIPSAHALVCLRKLNVLSVGEDDARWTSDNGLSMGGELDRGATSGDHARGTHETTLGTLLHQSAVAEHISRRSVQQDSGEGHLELHWSFVIKDHARVPTRELQSFLEFGGQMNVLSGFLSDHDARRSDEHDIMGEAFVELGNGTVSPNDARVTNDTMGREVASTTLGARKTLVVELNIFAGVGHNASGINQHVVVNHLLSELNNPGRTHS